MACEGTYTETVLAGMCSWTIDYCPGMPPTCRPMHGRRQCFPLPVMENICGWGAEERFVWDHYLQTVCGSTPNACCVMDRKPRSTS